MPLLPKPDEIVRRDPSSTRSSGGALASKEPYPLSGAPGEGWAGNTFLPGRPSR
jgi:hypothetical protein